MTRERYVTGAGSSRQHVPYTEYDEATRDWAAYCDSYECRRGTAAQSVLGIYTEQASARDACLKHIDEK